MATAEWLRVILLLSFCSLGAAIQCYQCDSNEDTTCPSEEAFDTAKNAVVECNSFEAHVPGQFCMKVYQESPGFCDGICIPCPRKCNECPDLRRGGWQKTTRRCGSRTDFGVAWGCRWTWDYTGVFRETCYCEDKNGCNSASPLSLSVLSAVLILLAAFCNMWL